MNFTFSVTFKDNRRKEMSLQIQAVDFTQAWSKMLATHMRHLGLEEISSLSLAPEGEDGKGTDAA